MNKKKLDKSELINKYIVLGLILIVLIVLLLGGTYSWLYITKTDETENIIKAGKISMVLDENLSDGINIKSAYPMTDNEGKNQSTLYKFKIHNDGDTDNNYEIYLVDNEIANPRERMNDNAIKYRLQKENSFDKIDYISNLDSVELNGDSNLRKLDAGTIEIGGEETYILQVWIDYNAGNEIEGKTFSKKLRIEASQIVK